MKLGQNGDKIVSEITKEMKKLTVSEDNLKHLNNIDSQLKVMFKLWYDLMRIMKSVERSSLVTIALFKGKTMAFKAAIVRFFSGETVPGPRSWSQMSCLPQEPSIVWVSYAGVFLALGDVEIGRP